MTTKPPITRSEIELCDALYTAACNLNQAIQDVAILGDIDALRCTMMNIYTLVELTEQHLDIVNTEEIAHAVAPTRLVLQAFYIGQDLFHANWAYHTAQELHSRWVKRLPTGAALKALVEAQGKRAEWEELTFWKEEDHWSVTNAYGIDNVATLRTAEDFQRLINCLISNDGEIGPTPDARELPREQILRFGQEFHLAIGQAAADMLEHHRSGIVQIR